MHSVSLGPAAKHGRETFAAVGDRRRSADQPAATAARATVSATCAAGRAAAPFVGGSHEVGHR